MHVTTPDINRISEKYIVWKMAERNLQSRINQTGSMVVSIDRDTDPYYSFTSNSILDSIDNTVGSISAFNINNDFVKFQIDFTRQFERLSEYMNNLSFENALSNYSYSISSLLELKPETLTMELTYEKSVFYTFIKSDYTFYLQHFLEDASDESDEAVLSVFKNNEKLPSYAGNLDDTILEMSNILLPGNRIKIELPLHDLSC